VSPPVYRLLLAAHVVVSGGWLGIAAAKLALAVAAGAAVDAPEALYTSMHVVNVAFPPTAVGTLVTGVLLSLGTKWGLLRHYWVATKLALTVGVIATGVAMVDVLIQQSVAATSGQAVGDGSILLLGFAVAPATLLISLSAAHVLMLAAATVISVYKPWGKTRIGRRKSPVEGVGAVARDEVHRGNTVRTGSKSGNRAVRGAAQEERR
jgi:hypothetical protein